jgi:hypothetical protein
MTLTLTAGWPTRDFALGELTTPAGQAITGMATTLF